MPETIPKTRGSILVIRGGAIGDFILTLPVLRALRERFPRTMLEVLGYPHIVQLALAARLSDRVSAIEARGMAGFFARNGDLDENLASHFSEFSVIISYLYDPDGIFRDNVARCTEARFIAGPHRPNEKEPVHATDALLEPLEELAIFDADPVPRMSIPEEPSSALLDLGNLGNGSSYRWLAIHPGSGGESKNWPESNWALLLERLVQETSARILLIGGEAEGDRLTRLAMLIPTDRLRMARNLPLVRVARLLEQCDAFIGHDSGISHLAGAVALPGLLLWGDTDLAVWKPRTELLRVVRSPDGLSGISQESVFTELGKLL